MPSSSTRSFSSDISMLFCVTLLGNGIAAVSYPPTLYFAISWVLILSSLLLLLIFLHDPPILAIFYEIASMALLPTHMAVFMATKSLKLAGISIIMGNAGIIIPCYLVYYAGSWVVGRRRSSSRPENEAAATEVFPKLLTGLNPFMEVFTVFTCNTLTMTAVCTLQFQANNLKVASGLSMIIFSIYYLISSIVSSHRSQVATLRRLLEAANALQSEPAVTGRAAPHPDEEELEETRLDIMEDTIEVVVEPEAGSSSTAVAAASSSTIPSVIGTHCRKRCFA